MKLTSKIAASLTLIIGIIWILGVVFFFLTVAGISSPLSNLAVIEAVITWSIGPVSLIVGSVLALVRKAPKISSVLCIGAALVLSGIVITAVYSVLHPQPLQAPPSYEFNAVLVLIAILCDACVFWLTLNWKQRQRRAGANTGGFEE